MRGSLETISVAELCMQLGGQGVSGTLSVESDGHTGQIAFQDGAVVWATSPSRGARIGDRLVHAGLLDPYYVDQAAQAQREAPAGTGIAALLVDRGLISADAARVFLQEQMIDALTDLLGWRTGSFDLSSDPPPVIRLAVAVPTESLLTEVRRRLAEQQRVRSVVTSLALVPSPMAHAPQNLALDESVVLRQVDGTSTVGDLAARLGFGDNEARRIVYGLTLLDAVSLNGEAAPTDDPLDEVEHAIEDSLDEALAGKLSEGAGDELESILEGLLTGPTEPAVASVDEPLALEESEEADAPVATVAIEEPAAVITASEPGAPSRIEAGRFDTDDVDEPRPWVGYAKALPGTAPRDRTPPPPRAATSDDMPYVASAVPFDATPERPSRGTGPDPGTRTEAASWLADVTDPSAPDEQDFAPTSDMPSSPEEPIWAVDAGSEPDEPDRADLPPVDEPPTVEVEEPPLPPIFSTRRSGGDDLSALLAELSSLSTDDDPGDRTPAPPPRKPSPTGPADDDAKDPRKRRRFGR